MAATKVIANVSLLAVGILALQQTALAGFPDVAASHANYDAIIYTQEQGIVSGYPDGTYRPDNTINRAEFTKIIVSAQFQNQLNGCLLGHGGAASFLTDLDVMAWYARYICVAFDHSLIQGYPDGTFRANTTINFVEAAKILVTAFRVPQTQTSTWYEGYVRALASQNAIPTSIQSFDQPITRGEMAEIIYRLKVGITNKPSKTYDDLARTTANWMPFTSTFFTLSFSIPSGFEVKESKNHVVIAQSPYYTRDIGDNNAFMTLTRYDQYNTRESQVALYRKLIKNIQESHTMVDGSSFLTLKGDDWGRFEGDSAGKVTVVFFEASSLEIIERPANSDQNFDPTRVGKQILSTFRFTK